ncbi:transcriptional regulator swi6 [Lithohypha guttulata]|nr:transcriptional regulator swi6 [Lithohypha guttulata]
MASSVQSVYPQPPGYPSHAHSNSLHGSFSQSQIGSFDTLNQSVASTPAPTPPPPRPSSQQQMAFSINGSHTQMMPPNHYGAYPEPNMFAQSQYQINGSPQIYTAVYSNVSVFEMEVNGVAVMRRRADGWLNATQILKVAGVDKGKRTKVLEKEILTGQHEKVQGGYGKYQGTWINYQRGREFCRQYGVEQALLPLLEYDINADGAAGQQNIETPTKEQAMAAQRKRMFAGDNRPMSQSQGGTFFKNMSSTAANAINALNRTRVDSPARTTDGRRSVGPRRQSQQHFSQDLSFMGGSQHSVHSLPSQDSFNANNGVLSQNASFADYQNTDEPPRKRMRPTPENSFMNSFDGAIDNVMDSPNEVNQAFFAQANQSFMAAQPFVFGLEPLPHPNGSLEERRKELLLDLFMDPNRSDFEDHPAFLTLSGEEFEVPIDTSCNTALHWAATLARIPLVKKLMDKGFNIRRTNSGGETALIAACQARNNLDQNSFPALLDLLGPSIEIRDGRGRTMLHHIAVSSAMKGRAAVGKYYLESLLGYVLKQSHVANPNSSSAPMTLTRFMAEIVNAQDKSGDTALNLAARTSTRAIIDQLLEVGADAFIANRGALAPIDFGVGADNGQTARDPTLTTSFDASQSMNASQQSFEEAKEGFMTSMNGIFAQADADFETEMKTKDDILNKTNAALKESSNALIEERKKLEELIARTQGQDELAQKVKNLRRFNQELREQLSASSQVQDNVPVGEADKGLDLDGKINNVNQLFPNGAQDLGSNLSPEQIQLLTSLERAEVLTGRVQAYQTHNALLENEARGLKGKSKELEDRYRKIISLCTGTPEERVDDLLDQLVQAVVSEQKDMASSMDLIRVRDFLRNVQQDS